MKTKVLLVYPEFPVTYWGVNYALQFVKKKAANPPLGLMTVAAMMPDTYELTLVDMNVEPLLDTHLVDADLVFLSAMLIQSESFNAVVRRARALHKTIVAGGPYPTSSYASISGVDHFVLNEAEITLPLFLRDYEQGRALPLYASEEKPDISAVPVPRFDLINVHQYASIPLQYSRGCPFNCEFCDIIEMFGRKPRTKSVPQFLAELDAVHATGYRGAIFIVDDNFIGNKKHAKELLHAVVQWQDEHNQPFTLYTEASINLAQDEELLDLMIAARFTMVFIGIETPVPAVLSAIHKDQNTRVDVHESVKIIQNKGIEVLAGFILGFDNDPENIFDLQIDFIQKSGTVMAMVGLLMALPNTQLYRRLQKEGRMIGESSGNNTHDLNMNFVPVMPQEVLIEGYKRILKHIYSARNYFDRCLVLLDRFPRKSYKSRSSNMNDYRALALSFIKQTFSRYGFWYIRYLIKAIILNPQNFHLTVALAVKGYHFMKITDDILRAEKVAMTLNARIRVLEERIIQASTKRDAVIVNDLARTAARYRRITRFKQQFLSQGVRHYVDKKLALFDRHCEKIIAQIRAGRHGQLQEMLPLMPGDTADTL